jgi:hypothetical protein
MVSGLTGQPPIAVQAKHAIGDYGQRATAGEQVPISFKVCCTHFFLVHLYQCFMD